MKRFVALSLLLVVSGCSSSPRTASVPLPAFTPWPNIEPEQSRMLSVSRLKQLALGIAVYRSKNDDKLPDLTSPAAMRAEVYPFLTMGGLDIFVHPKTGEPFEVNVSLSKTVPPVFPGPSPIALAYEASADGNLTRAVAYTDGHVKRVEESEWPAIKAASNIP